MNHVAVSEDGDVDICGAVLVSVSELLFFKDKVDVTSPSEEVSQIYSSADTLLDVFLPVEKVWLPWHQFT